jgi:hypothetical protein
MDAMMVASAESERVDEYAHPSGSDLQICPIAKWMTMAKQSQRKKYQDTKEAQVNFKTVELSSWRNILRYAKKGCLFRGQRDAIWPLKTALERCCDQQKIPAMDRFDVEARICREFRRAYHQYGLHIPRKKCMLEWLALMQHHGSPTRLLDFTYSIYVAAYFALEYAEAETDSAVWRIRRSRAIEESINLLSRAGKKDAYRLGQPYDEQDDELFNKTLLDKSSTLCACPQTPFRLNERLRIQMGVFMAPGSVTASFEQNLQALPGHNQGTNVLKIEIPLEFRDDALVQLFDMSISRRTLFPGLDGFAQSLAVYTPAYKPVP